MTRDAHSHSDRQRIPSPIEVVSDDGVERRHDVIATTTLAEVTTATTHRNQGHTTHQQPGRCQRPSHDLVHTVGHAVVHDPRRRPGRTCPPGDASMHMLDVRHQTTRSLRTQSHRRPDLLRCHPTSVSNLH